jgi:transcriptional regulator with XRE-family HTH domain
MGRTRAITEDVVAELRKLREAGMSQRQVAERLGISKSAVVIYDSPEALEAYQRRKAEAVALRKEARALPRQPKEKLRKLDHRQTIAAREPLLRQVFDEIWAARLTQEEVAARAGVSWNVLTRWKKGHSDPRLSLFKAVAQTLGYELVLVKRDV